MQQPFGQEKPRRTMNPIHITYKFARRVAITVVGGTILLIGIVMVVTPGPAVVFIPIGLAILGIEFAWARSWLKKLRQSISSNSSTARAARAEQHRQRHMNR